MSTYIHVDMKPGSAEELESEFSLRWGVPRGMNVRDLGPLDTPRLTCNCQAQT